MKQSLKYIPLLLGAFGLTACSTFAPAYTSPPASAKMIAPQTGGEDAPEDVDLNTLQDYNEAANAAVQQVFPKGGEGKITLWAPDLENLVDGTFTQTFGGKLAPSPSLKLHKVFKNSGVSVIDHLHVKPCQGAADGPGQYWVLRSYVSDLDETVERRVKGFYPNAESGDFQTEIDRGSRSMTDRFKLSAKLTDCRSGRIIHSAENEFSKTASSQDNSVYLFGKYFGIFYRNTAFEDPGLNRTKDMALDVFLSSVAMDMVGAQRP